MVKKRFGPKLKMDGLPKASKAHVYILSLPKEIETMFDTGYGENKNSKWEMDIRLLNHPTQETRGDMVWQTTAQVIRIEIMNLIEMVNNKPKAKENLADLLKDLQGCHLVRKYMHSLQLCEHCIDVIQSLSDLD
jgi:alkyl hydroperoxide reductase subunit AhpF